MSDSQRTWKSPNPSVTIPSARNVSLRSQDNECWTVYKIVVSDQPDTYEIEKRFSAFAELHAILVDLYQKNQVPQFAKTSFWENKFLPEVIERRRKDLERYLNALLTNPTLRDSTAVREFLQPFTPQRSSHSNAAPRQAHPVVYNEHSQASEHQSNIPSGPFFLPPIPSGLRIPNQFIIQGRSIYLNPILQDAYNLLVYLSSIYHQLAAIPSTDEDKRSTYLLDNKESLESVTQRLAQQIFNLESLLNRAVGSIDSNIAIHLTACLSSMEQGMKYSQQILEETAIFASIQSALRDSLRSSANEEFLASEGIQLEPEESEAPPQYSSVANAGGQPAGSPGINLHKDEPPSYPQLINLEKEEVDEARKINLEKEEVDAMPEINLNKSDSLPINLKKEESEEPELPLENLNINEVVMDVSELEVELYGIRKKVDDILIKVTETDSKSNSMDLVEQLRKLRADIRNTIDVVEMHECDSAAREILDKFRALSSEISGYCDSISARSFNTPPTQDPLAIVESKLFTLIQRVHDTEASDTATAIQLKEKMKNIKEALRTMRHQERYTKAQKERLEDFQENLSDLQHTFAKKFKLPSKKRDKVVVDIRVKQAQKQFQAIEDDMFSL